MNTISQSTPKARKDHKCDWCSEKIKVGEKYSRSFIKYDDVYVWKNHIYCGQIASELNMFQGDDGITGEDFKECIENEYQYLMSKHCIDIYESKDFKYPEFRDQLKFVMDFHDVHSNGKIT